MRMIAIMLLSFLPYAAAAQESDKDFLTRFLEENLSSAGRMVTISGFQGALSSQATMAEMTIADDQGVWLTVRDVTLDWSRSALLSGRIVIQEFSAGEILLDRIPAVPSGTTSEARSFKLPDLPVTIDIQTIAARHIALGPTVLGQPVEGQLTASMQLFAGEGAARLDLTRTDTVSHGAPVGQFHLTVAYQRDITQLSLSLSAVEGAGGVAVSLLGVPGKPSAALLIEGSGPLAEFGAEVSFKTDGVTRLAGRVQMTQSASGPGFVADLAGDPTPVFLPQYATFFGPDVALHARGQRFADGKMQLSEFTLTAQALALEGRLSLDSDLVPQTFALKGKMGLPEGSVVLPLASHTQTQVRAGSLSLTYDRGAGGGWQGRAWLQGFENAAIQAESVQLSGAGHILRGPEEVRFDGLLDFDAAGLIFADSGLAQALGRDLRGSAQLYWQTGASLAITDLSLSSAGVELMSTGTLGAFAEGLPLTGSLHGSVDDLARLSTLAGRPLAGAARFALAGTGALLTGFADVEGKLEGQGITTGIAALDGLLSADSAIILSLRRDVDGTDLRRLTLVAAGTSAAVAGKITSDGVDLEGDFGAADLAVLGERLHGALQGKVALKGPFEAIEATLDATGRDLVLGQNPLDALFAGNSHLILALTLRSGIVQVREAVLTLPVASMRAMGEVSTTGNNLSATVQLDDLGVLIAGLHGTADGRLHFTGQPTDGRLTIDAGAEGLVTGQPMVDPLLRGRTRLTSTLDLTGSGALVQDLNLASPQMHLVATGQVTGGALRLELEHRLVNLGFLYPQFPGKLISKGSLIQNPTGYVLDFASNGPGQIDARIKGRLSRDFRSNDLTIIGTAAAGLANKLAAPLSLSGPVRFDLALRGPIALASLTGSVSISGGRLADPAQNFGLTDVAGTAQLAGGRAAVRGSARVTTGGSIGVTGTIGLTGPYDVDLAVAVNSVSLRDPDLYSTTTDGALTIQGPLLGTAQVSGTVELGQTELRIPSTGFGADGTVPGLKHVNEPAERRATRSHAGVIEGEQVGSGSATGGGYGLNLRVSAPNRVFIRGRGLDAELGGHVILRGRTDAVEPVGAFNLIRGRLDILGRRLNLSEALFQMQGALVPFIRIVAAVESDGIIASVVMEGAANDPTVNFSSIPDLPQEEVLARLLFDRGLDSLTVFQTVQLAGAVATLAGKGGEGVIGSLRKRTGFDNLDVTQDAANSTAVTIGKYLSDKAYTEATVGQAGKSSISLNLDIAPHITLKGKLESDGQTGIGIFLQRDY